eukprot:9503893-Pyramimonas_sp.AAC.1
MSRPPSAIHPFWGSGAPAGRARGGCPKTLLIPEVEEVASLRGDLHAANHVRPYRTTYRSDLLHDHGQCIFASAPAYCCQVAGLDLLSDTPVPPAHPKFIRNLLPERGHVKVRGGDFATPDLLLLPTIAVGCVRFDRM